ncbi:MCE family protein [Christiangramia fulva]|uniref:MCE family protein n=1 Tax=Christiangramia fulva TaxID=2126553 RepID=A0A2R3Z7I8_9FLAO|nr:MlaD family protein [Christiangramia fulva]AVR46239.1 MCE family protein [Christiangramia fulva]
MEKSNSQKLKLGVFVVIGTLILIVALYFIGNKQHMFTSNIILYSEFENINGLQIGNNVRYSGINVGNVKKIEMLGERRILVEMMIDESTGKFIQKDAIASIGSDGLVGSMVLNIVPGNLNPAPVKSGDTIASYSRIGADDMLSTLNVTNENAALLTSDLLKITNKILKGKGTLGVLISDSTMAGNIKQSLFNLKNASEEADLAIAKINRQLENFDLQKGVAGVLLNDTLRANQMKDIITNLENSSEKINAISAEIDGLVKEIRGGNGALNYLTKNEALVKNIDTTMLNIKESSVKFNENMEALRDNFFFRHYFKKLERQKQKELKKD